MSTRSERATQGWIKGRATMDARFWEKVDQSGGPETCWPWLGAIQTRSPGGHGGYGYFFRLNKVRYAHRRALELTLGRSLEPGEIALHTCDNPPCCNPAHLRAGTQLDNM